MNRFDGDHLSMVVEFAGAGGDSQGAAAVPGVQHILAANHDPLALASHEANFPDVDHICEDITKTPMDKLPPANLFWASPACPPWTDARGKKRDFDKVNQQALPGLEPEVSVNDMRARALMEEVPRYLEYCVRRGRPVLAGVVENVIQCRLWGEWRRWVREIEALGYRTRLIALNSMHAQSVRTPRAPQSRDRLYFAYWHQSLGRDPDWNRWLRPRAWCPTCDQYVAAVQAWKRPGQDMGRYRAQYLYRCPKRCNTVVEPDVVPAAAAIDWSLPGRRVGDWADYRPKPHAQATRDRIAAGLRRWRRPITVEVAGNTFERRPGVRTWPVDAPMTTQTTTATKALAYPPLLVPVEGREGKAAATTEVPLRTQTARNETALAWLPFIVPLRGGGDKDRARPVTDPLATVTASGTHHGLVTVPAMVMRNNGSRGGDGGEHCTPVSEPIRTLTTAGHQSLVTWDHMLVPYYSNSVPQSVAEPMATVTTRDRFALASYEAFPQVDVDDVLLRMLEPHEIGAGMAFFPDYVVLGDSKRKKVRQYGNAVTPPAAEVIVSALVECIAGELLEA